MSRSLPMLFCLFFICCKYEKRNNSTIESNTAEFEFKYVREIPLPEGFKRIDASKDSFDDWLRNVKLKKDKHVYLYDGSLKKNQSAQFAVMDIQVGKKNLQQCADAVMRLRAEYLFVQKKYAEINFTDYANKVYQWTGPNNRAAFENYLSTVFGSCGSASLEKELKPVDNMKGILPGDVLIRGGFPGHAMIVMDVAINNNGDKVFMLAQSYTPAQDIHIVKNPMDNELSPWYMVSSANEIFTPAWKFYTNQLRRW